MHPAPYVNVTDTILWQGHPDRVMQLLVQHHHHPNNHFFLIIYYSYDQSRPDSIR